MFTFSNFKKGLKSQTKGTTTTRDFDYDGKKVCVVCGKRIRTGWKYCFEHRNTQQFKNKNYANKELVGLGGILILFGMIIIFAGGWIFGLIVIVAGVLLIISQPKINNRKF